MPGIPASLNTMADACNLHTTTVKSALQHLVAQDLVLCIRESKNASAVWTLQIDTRPEVMPLNQMQFCGAIFTPGVK